MNCESTEFVIREMTGLIKNDLFSWLKILLQIRFSFHYFLIFKLVSTTV